MKDKYCFVIVGPTAAGKTHLAIELARFFNTLIISADSRQCFKELNIGVAKPSPHQLREITHFFVNTHSIHQPVNAKLFEEYATSVSEKILEQHDILVVVGGTGLYINAFCNGLDQIPMVDEVIKNNILSCYENQGIQWLQNEVEMEDPLYFKTGEIKNPQRLIRALEVKLSTGRSITEFQKQRQKEHRFKIIRIGLELGKEQLHNNINNRTDAMMKQGLLDEVKGLLPYKHFNALNTVGYRELFSYLNGELTLDEAIARIKLNTRRYAKRQLTWFKKDNKIKWVDATMDEWSFVQICSRFTGHR